MTKTRAECARSVRLALRRRADFLTPLNEYLAELARILKPGGMLVWTVKDMVKSMDKSVYVNTDWDVCVQAMEAAGLETSIGEGRGVGGDGRSGYTPIIGKKK
jgi:hypothetical protein